MGITNTLVNLVFSKTQFEPVLDSGRVGSEVGAVF